MTNYKKITLTKLINIKTYLKKIYSNITNLNTTNTTNKYQIYNLNINPLPHIYQTPSIF